MVPARVTSAAFLHSVAEEASRHIARGRMSEMCSYRSLPLLGCHPVRVVTAGDDMVEYLAGSGEITRTNQNPRVSRRSMPRKGPSGEVSGDD
jgi:hypothetical protein